MTFSPPLRLLLLILLAPSSLLPPTTTKTSAQVINGLFPQLALSPPPPKKEYRTFSSSYSSSSTRPPVTFALTYSYGNFAPDNFIQDTAILTNGVFPGPPIRVRPYDTLVLRVTNALSHGISLHFHGLRNFGAPEADGVPHVTQDKILPGETFQYVVPIGSQSGTFIYHLHTGLDSVWAFGPLIVDDSSLLAKHRRYTYDFDYVFSLSQLWHNDTRELEAGLKGVPFEDLPPADSLLINGRSFGSWPQGTNGLNSGYDSLTVQPGKTYRFRIIGFGTDSILSFAIDKHKMTIIEVDGIIVKPVEVDRLEVNSGQRYSVLVKMGQEPDNYWIRSEMIPGPGPKNGRALIHYDKAGETSAIRMELNEGQTEAQGLDAEMWEWSVGLRPNKKIQQPSVYSFPKNVDREIVVRSGEVTLPDGGTRFAVNGEVWTSPKTPLLFQVRNEGVNITKEPQVFQSHTNKVIQLVFQNVANSEGVCEQHPWHVHGHSFYVVGHGPGEYNATIDGPKITRKLAGRRGRRRAVLRDVVTLCPSVLSSTIEATPTSNVTLIPASNDTSIPASNVTSIPASSDTSIPASNDTSTPTSNDTSIPASNDTSIPASNDTSIPASNDTSIPVSNDNPTIIEATPPILNSSSSPDSVNRTRRSPRVASSSSESSEYKSTRSKKKSSRRRHSRKKGYHSSSSSSEESDEQLVDSDLLMEDHSLMRHSLLLEGLPPSSGCGWVAVRFVTNNPGVWLIHCHLTAHLIMGKQFVLYSYPKDNPRLLSPDSSSP